MFSLLSTIMLAADYENTWESRLGASLEWECFDGFDLIFAPQVRWKGVDSYSKTLLELDLAYDVKGWFKLGLGSRFVFERPVGDLNEVTSRLDAEISRTFDIDKFFISPRVRYMHYFNINDVMGEADSGVFRYKVGFGYEHKKDFVFVPEIVVEAFHTVKTNDIAAIRYSVGGKFNIAKGHTVNAFYSLDNDFMGNKNRHIIEVVYKYSF